MRSVCARRKEIAAVVAGLEEWMRAERAKLSRHAAVAKATDYMLTRWGAFSRFRSRYNKSPFIARYAAELMAPDSIRSTR